MDGWGTLPIGVFYGAYTHPLPGKKFSAEFRLFGMYYHDWRTDAHLSAGIYFAHVHGDAIAAGIYPQGKNANFGFIEMNWRF